MDLSIIIVNWNTSDLLANCLHSVSATVRDLDYEVIVLDNASTDNSADMVRTRFPQVKLIESRANLGFARGNNVALDYTSGKYVLLLNPDTVVLDLAINLLYEALETYPFLGAVGAQLLNSDGSDQDSWGPFPNLLTEVPLLNRLTRGASRPLMDAAGHPIPSLIAVDWLSGACVLLKRSAVEQVGLFDEGYWLYTEEVDWCFRARAAGWGIAFEPGVRVIHIRQAASRQRYAETAQYFYLSRLRFLKKHVGKLHAQIALVVLWLKVSAWIAMPKISPLSRAFPDLSVSDVRSAYRRLLKRVVSPLDTLLASG